MDCCTPSIVFHICKLLENVILVVVDLPEQIKAIKPALNNRNKEDFYHMHLISKCLVNLGWWFDLIDEAKQNKKHERKWKVSWKYGIRICRGREKYGISQRYEKWCCCTEYFVSFKVNTYPWSLYIAQSVIFLQWPLYHMRLAQHRRPFLGSWVSLRLCALPVCSLFLFWKFTVLTYFSILVSDIGAAYGTAKSGVGIASMGVMHPGLVMKNIIPVVMAGVLGIYGLIVAVIIQGSSE